MRIALAAPNNKVFEFMERSYPDFELPEDFASRFMLSKQLGWGTCGEVRLCLTKGSDEKYAVKIVEKKKFGAATEWNMRGVKVLQTLDHPNIIRIFEGYETTEKVFILLEYADSEELSKWIVNGLSSRRAIERCSLIKPVFAQMAFAVKYLHLHKIVHTNLKPQNVLLTGEPSNYLVKITDFGMSQMRTGNSLLRTLCGTPTHLAPEIVYSNGYGSYTEAVDCWSLGVILFQMITGYPPSSSDYEDLAQVDRIEQPQLTALESKLKDIDADVEDLIQRLLKVDPLHRPTIDQVLAHPWFRDEGMKIKLTTLLPHLIMPFVRPKLQPSHKEVPDTLDRIYSKAFDFIDRALPMDDEWIVTAALHQLNDMKTVQDELYLLYRNYEKITHIMTSTLGPRWVIENYEKLFADFPSYGDWVTELSGGVPTREQLWIWALSHSDSLYKNLLAATDICDSAISCGHYQCKKRYCHPREEIAHRISRLYHYFSNKIHSSTWMSDHNFYVSRSVCWEAERGALEIQSILSVLARGLCNQNTVFVVD